MGGGVDAEEKVSGQVPGALCGDNPSAVAMALGTQN
jgi:hypothetical protein